MNVQREATIAMTTLHAQMRKVHLYVLVILASQEVERIAKVSRE